MATILETKDYSKFELHPFNRDPKHQTKQFKELLKSMQEHGWIDAYPAHVVKNGSNKLKIKAGHNRVDAARQLGIPIKYVVCSDDIKLPELEKSHSPWNMKDFMTAYSNEKGGAYAKISDYVRRFGIPLNVAIPLLQKDGKWAGYVDAFKSGKFEIGNPSHAETVGNLVLYCSELGIPFARNSRFVWALSKVIQVDGVEIDELKKKIKSHIYLVKKQADIAGFVTMLEQVYNRQRSQKIAIAVNAL